MIHPLNTQGIDSFKANTDAGLATLSNRKYKISPDYVGVHIKLRGFTVRLISLGGREPGEHLDDIAAVTVIDNSEYSTYGVAIGIPYRYLDPI